MRLSCAGFPSKAEVANAGRALHMLLNKDEIAAIKKKAEADDARSPGGKTTDFAGAQRMRQSIGACNALVDLVACNLVGI